MKHVLLAAAAALAAAAVAVGGAQAQNGSFRGSCRNVTSLGNGAFSAECADSAGRFRSSAIQANQCQGDIGNQNGLLACNGAVAQGGAYVPDASKNRNSSNNGDAGGSRYEGDGRYGGGGRYDERGSGGYRNDREDRDDRGSRNGFSSRGGVVAGSYQSSCRYGETIQGGYLSAECADSQRRYRQSTIQYTACRGDISNQNGMLACQGAVATGGTYSRN